MSVAVLYKVVKTAISGPGVSSLELDATLSESPQFDSEVTEHPVEAGFNIADGIRNKPISLTLEGFVSNTPIMQERDAKETGGFLKGNPGRANEALAILEQLREAQDVVKVVTRMREYPSMAITSIKATRDSKTGDALSFTMSLKQVRVVSSRYESYPKEARGKKKVAKGDKAKVEVFHENTSKSVGVKLVKGIKGLFGK
jgi:hypothetical protein